MSSLIAIEPDGNVLIVPCSYEGIKFGLRGATLCFVRATEECGFYIDDEGMLNGQPLNIPVSVLIGRPIWGPAVLCHGEPDEEGDTLPANPGVMAAAQAMADQWVRVVESAARQGQTVVGLAADSATIPPPEVIMFADHDEFMSFLRGEED